MLFSEIPIFGMDVNLSKNTQSDYCVNAQSYVIGSKILLKFSKTLMEINKISWKLI